MRTPEEARAAKTINIAKRAARQLRHGNPLKPIERQALENLSKALAVFGKTPEEAAT